MKTDTEYGIFYVNEVTKEKVAFKHAIPVHFNRNQAEQFVKDMILERWRGGGTLLPQDWSMRSFPLTLPTECDRVYA